LIFAILLPSVGVSLYFYSTVKDGQTESNNHITEAPEEKQIEEDKPQFSWERAYDLLWQHFCEAYRDPTILQWSFWYV
jgi:hypothetical protein